MSADNITKNLWALWRADRIIADIRLKHLLGNMGMKAFAALFAAFGLLMFELAAYFALVQVWNAILAAAALGAFNIVLAAVIVIVAAKRPIGRDFDLANEIHGQAIDALQLEAQSLQAQATGIFQNPLNSVLPSLIIPLITILIKSLRTHKPPPAAEPG